MSSNVDVNKQFAMQNVSAAVKLDANGDSMDAYRKYLECIEFMSHQLFLDASQCSGPWATDSALKFIALCRQCVERVDDLIKTLPVHTARAESDFRAANQNLPNFMLPVSPSNIKSLPRPEVVTCQSSVKEMSPIELARWQNDCLVTMHKARIEKLAPNNQMTANLSLSLQRRMMENMAIAQQRQRVLEKKKEERLKRLQAEADRRFSCHAGMSPDELGRRKLYTEILEYEQDVKWLMELRRKVPEKCREPSFVVACVQGILGDSDHPLTRLLQGYQKSICMRALDAANLASSPHACTPLSSEPEFISSSERNTTHSSPFQREATDLSQKDDKSRTSSSSSSKHAMDQLIGALVSEVQAFLEKLETMFVVTYEDFDDEEIRYVLQDLLEDIFFQPVWPYILSFFRQSTSSKEQIMYEVMRAKCAASPADIGVSEKFTLCQSPTDSSLSQKFEVPYHAAVNSFQSVVHVPSPAKKLDCIVQSSQLICQCIDEFYAHSAISSPQMGADEMLPVLSYIILKTEQPILVTECYALMEFIDESSLMGERGYCLTSVMTAIDFLLTLSSKSAPAAKP